MLLALGKVVTVTAIARFRAGRGRWTGASHDLTLEEGPTLIDLWTRVVEGLTWTFLLK